MIISEIYIENFRIFGSEKDGEHLNLNLNDGLNVLAGENDSGKSAVIDAIRYLLLTSSRESILFNEDDFHVKGDERADNLTIRCKFSRLSEDECGGFLEYCSIEDDVPALFVTLQASLLTGTRGTRISVTRRAGKKGEGLSIEGQVREDLRSTYLRPLRDAERELSSGKGSRLAQILRAKPESKEQEICRDDFNPGDVDCRPKTIVEIMRHAEVLIENNEFITEAKDELNRNYLNVFSLGGDKLEGDIGLAKKADIKDVLEKLELWLNPKEGLEKRTPRGLGLNNVLFMATELLLLSGEEYNLPLLLIEEPEAHLHPQMQLHLMDFLEEKAKEKGIQIIMSTHSPNLASKVNIENIIIMCDGTAYQLTPEQTKLEKEDYLFLKRFLDVTKANLFFAKAVVIVEGDAENILLPTLSELIGMSFSDNGVSIVKVGSRGLYRYSRILQRSNDQEMPIKVACIADRDIVPDEADYAVTETRKPESKYEEKEIEEIVSGLQSNDGGSVKTFVSEKWTLEYDLVRSGLGKHMFVAIELARKKKSLSEVEESKLINEAIKEFEDLAKGKTNDEIASLVYKPLYEKSASKAETAQYLAKYLIMNKVDKEEMKKLLPEYIVKSIEYVTG